MLVDAHCHLHEFPINELVKYCGRGDLSIIAVSDDYPSSLRTLEISSNCPNVIPAVGIHPWNVGKVHIRDELKPFTDLLPRVKFLGEVGIDKRFKPESYSEQLEVFKYFLGLARDYGLGVNVHAAGAWREAIDQLIKYEVSVAVIHWYTGPIELLKELENAGFYITINPAIRAQEKLRNVVKEAPLSIILTESDGPYVYRGLKLTPDEVPLAINEIASIKELDVEEVSRIVYENYIKLLSKIGITLG